MSAAIAQKGRRVQHLLLFCNRDAEGNAGAVSRLHAGQSMLAVLQKRVLIKQHSFAALPDDGRVESKRLQPDCGKWGLPVFDVSKAKQMW